MSGLIALVLRNRAPQTRSGRRPSSPSPFSAEELEYLQSIYEHLPSELDLDDQHDENDEQGSSDLMPTTKPVTFEGIPPSDSWNALEVVAAQFTAFSCQAVMSVFAVWLLAFVAGLLFVSSNQNP